MNDIEKIKELYNNPVLIKQYQDKYEKDFPEQHDIQGLPLLFDKDAKNILINFSGGADSTLLLYFLCKLIQEKNFKTKVYPVTYLRFADTKPWLEKVVVNVYNYFKLNFPDIIQEQLWGFVPTEFETVKISKLENPQLDAEFPSTEMHCDVLCTLRYQEYIMRKYKIDYVYSGTTTNPSDFIEGEPAFRNISINIENISWALQGPAINPFAFIKKNWVLSQYQKLHLNDLLGITRSCSADTKLLGAEYLYNNQIPHECGICFFCKEKQWAKENMKEFI